MKTLVLLLLLQIHLITCSKNSSIQKEMSCYDWFPEPITYRLDESHSQLTLDFKIIDDLISDRNVNESNQIVEDYVIRILNMENGSGGYSDILGIVFKHLPTVRQLIISIFCIKTAVIIFSIIWKLGFSEIFEVLGIALRFNEYRSGLTIIPIFCCLGLLILTSNLRSSSGFIMDGIDNLELKNDERFMPIQDRVARKLEMTPCFFDKDFARNIKMWRIEDRYLTKVVNISMFDKLLPISEIEERIDRVKPRSSFFGFGAMFNAHDICKKLENEAGQMVLKLGGDLKFENLQSEVEKLQEEYKEIIRKSINISIPSTKEAIGSIGGFVEKYHQNVILIPKIHIINFYEKFVATTVALTVAVSATLTVLFVLEFEFKKKWTKILAEMAVFIVIIFMIISLFLFLLLICRITFTVMVHDQVRKDSFAIFKKANPSKISKNKSINYGELLDVDSTPQSIEGAKLFESNRKFNESVERLAEIMGLEFEEYVEKSCEKSIKTVEEIEKIVEKTGCWKTKGLDSFLEILNSTKSTICSLSEELKSNPIDKSIIQETAYSKWVEALVPLKGLPVIRNSSMEIVRSPMQIYLVFENPSKKLRPTILEHMLDMAVGIGKMAPIYFILSIYFMCILPIMMDQNSEDGGGGSDEKTSKSTESRSKSKSLSNEK